MRHNWLRRVLREISYLENKENVTSKKEKRKKKKLKTKSSFRGRKIRSRTRWKRRIRSKCSAFHVGIHINRKVLFIIYPKTFFGLKQG